MPLELEELTLKPITEVIITKADGQVETVKIPETFFATEALVNASLATGQIRPELVGLTEAPILEINPL